jgi:hypothetical protein
MDSYLDSTDSFDNRELFSLRTPAINCPGAKCPFSFRRPTLPVPWKPCKTTFFLRGVARQMRRKRGASYSSISREIAEALIAPEESIDTQALLKSVPLLKLRLYLRRHVEHEQPEFRVMTGNVITHRQNQRFTDPPGFLNVAVRRSEKRICLPIIYRKRRHAVRFLAANWLSSGQCCFLP